MFEKVELLHQLYPAYLLGARIVAWMTYDDVETYNAVVLQRLHAKTDMLLGMIRQRIEMGRARRTQQHRRQLPRRAPTRPR